jgi:hypothetical protein
MEENQILDNAVSSQDGLVVTNNSRIFLNEIRKWAKFFAILGFIGIGFMIVAGVFFGSFMTAINPNLYGSQVGSSAVGIIYIVMGVIMIIPILYLNKFANNMKIALENMDNQQLELAFENFKSYYKFLGIFTIVIVSIYVVIILFGIIFGISRMF